MDMDATNAAVPLPHDVLLEILRRLPCRALARSRGVCRAWRATIDDTTLLLTHFRCLFPSGAFSGIFTSNDRYKEESSFFAPAALSSSRRPSSKTKKGGAPDGDEADGFRYPLFYHGWASVKDHSNGLMLLYHEKDFPGYYCVCNPATVRCARLPVPAPRMRSKLLHGGFHKGIFLAFDPAVSRHHEVFLFPDSKARPPPHLEIFVKNLMEPPEDQLEVHTKEPVAKPQPNKDEVLSLLVFSSRTGRWESREFVPAASRRRRCNSSGKNIFTILDDENNVQIWKSAEYWRGSLYVHCSNNILVIIRNNSHDDHETYDMVQLPGIPLEHEERVGIDELPTRSVLGSYDKGIHYVALNNMLQLQVWALDEPSSVDGQLGWTLTHKANLGPYVHVVDDHDSLLLLTQSMVPWKVVTSEKAALSLFEPLTDSQQRYMEYIKKHRRHHVPAGGRRVVKKDTTTMYSWDSDEDNFIDKKESTTHVIVEQRWYGYCKIIGLHPHKDVLLLHVNGNVLAYHLSSSRMQFLGKELVTFSDVEQCTQLYTFYGVKSAFPYRPCYVDALPTTKMPRRK